MLVQLCLLQIVYIRRQVEVGIAKNSLNQNLFSIEQIFRVAASCVNKFFCWFSHMTYKSKGEKQSLWWDCILYSMFFCWNHLMVHNLQNRTYIKWWDARLFCRELNPELCLIQYFEWILLWWYLYRSTYISLILAYGNTIRISIDDNGYYYVLLLPF